MPRSLSRSRAMLSRAGDAVVALLAALALPTYAAAQIDRPAVQYPPTAAVDIVDDYHGTKVPDPYRWLEDTHAPETQAWIAAQNEVTFGYLKSLPSRDALRERLTELWNYARYGTPFREGGRYFFFRNDGLQDQSVLYTMDSLADEPRLLLDPNTFSADGTVALTTLGVSADGRYLGYGTSSGGSDWRELRVLDVVTGTPLEDHIRWVKFSGLSWTEDGRGFFYSRYPEPEPGQELLSVNRDQKVYYHRVGTPQAEDVLVYERPDEPEWGFSAAVTEDGRYLVLYVRHGTDPRNRVYYMDLVDAQAPDLSGTVVKLLDDFDAAYRIVGNDGPLFYVHTDLDAPRWRVVAIDLRAPERERWREVVPEREEVLQSAHLVGGRLVARYLQDAHGRVRLFTLAGEPAGELPLSGIGTVGAISGRADSPELFYSFASFLYPTTIFRYDLDSGEGTVFRAPEVDFDPQRYETRQVFYRSRDGTRVPMFITHRRGIELDGSHPTYLYGYGGFNIPLTPGFSVANAAWLELGGVYALANLRGGGEYGREWHDAGRKENKQNVFDDFIAAAEHLIAEGWTRPDRLAIGGGSNGGLLVGAVENQSPELFAGANPAVGVMDMLRFHKFTIGWAWVSDYGSPDDPEMFPHLFAYSPLHNIRKGACYPATLVTTADHDDRVVPGHSFKYAAALQAAQACDRPVLIRVETRAGHGAGMPTRMQIEQAADVLAFRLANLGLANVVPRVE
jgi:prolyl oligopeptidase